MHRFLVLNDDSFIMHAGSQPAFRLPAPRAELLVEALGQAGLAATDLSFTDFNAELSGQPAAASALTLVLPYGGFYPKGTWPAIESFLKAGGNLLSLGGCPLVTELEKKGKVWPTGEPSRRIPTEVLKLRAYQVSGIRRLQASAGWKEILGFEHAEVEPPGTGIAAACIVGGMPRNRDVSYPLELTDRFGFLKGHPCALVRNYPALYSGSTWIIFGSLSVSIRGWEGLFQAAARYLAAGARIHDIRVKPTACRPGQEAGLECRLVGPAAGGQCRVEIELSDGRDGKALHRASREVSPGAGAEQSFSEVLRTDPSWKGFVHLRMNLRGTRGELLDTSESGWVVAEKPSRSECLPLALEAGELTVNGRPSLLFGANYFITGTGLNAFQEEPPVSTLHWMRDFKLMRDCGLTSVRAFIGRNRLSADGTMTGELVPGRFLANVSLFHLMMRMGLAPLICVYSARTPSGQDGWVDASVRGKQQEWTKLCVEQFKGLPVLWDLENEDGIHRLRPRMQDDRTVHEPNAFLQSEWNRWMRETLPGSELEDMRRAAGCGGNEDIPLPPIDRQSFEDRREKAWRTFAATAFRDWIKSLADSVRSVDPGIPVTYSHWEDAFYEMYARWSRETNGDMWFTHDGTDFNCVHIYWYEFREFGNEVLQDPVALVKYVAADSVGKPGIIGETGMDPPGSEEGLVGFVEQWCYSMLAGGGKGLYFWTWDEHIALPGEAALGRVDHTPSEGALRYRHFAFLTRYLAILKRDVEVFLVVSTAAKTSGRPDSYVRCIIEAMEELFDTGAEFRLIADKDLDRLPRTARVLIVASPLCMSAGTWDTIKAFARRGGSVYLSGFFDRDEWLHPVEPRMGELLGREAAGLSALAPSSEARRLIRRNVGKGNVLFVSQPLEYLRGEQSTVIKDSERRAEIPLQRPGALYREILEQAGVPMVRASGPAEGATVYPHPTSRGILYVIRNRRRWSSLEVNGFRVWPCGEYCLVEAGPRGVVLADASALAERGRTVFETASSASALVASQDREPIGKSKALVIKLKMPGSIAVRTESSWKEPVACVVSFDGKGCREVRRASCPLDGGRFLLSVPDDLTEYAWLIAEADRLPAEIRRIEDTWLMREEGSAWKG